MRRAAKVDRNQAAIVEALTRAGCLVQSLARVGNGVPDLLVGAAGRVYLLEVKDQKGTLTQEQRAWHARWGRCVAVVRTPTEAIRVVLGG